MRLVLFVIPFVFLLSCSAKENSKSVLTKSSDQVTYLNEYFELEVTKPAGWYSQDPESTMKMSKMGADMVAKNDQNMKLLVEESLKSTVPIFAFFESMPGTPVKTNPSVISLAENIDLLPGVKSGCDYLFHAKQILENSAVAVTISEGCNTVSMNGSSFGYIDLNMRINGVEVLQRYYACVKGEHALSIIQTFFDGSSKTKVDAVLDSVHVKCA